mmetsp:Transcript_15823/g.60249  ORF Transcript_15823/g.60249 Transcript_15823/m.60249 type:complete len:229 (-) Transcript_15823:1621-2307(-)|eukprot:scaffold442_cov268-Pinguiococcus_pyrenoidosus.AAC.10
MNSLVCLALLVLLGAQSSEAFLPPVLGRARTTHVVRNVMQNPKSFRTRKELSDAEKLRIFDELSDGGLKRAGRTQMERSFIMVKPDGVQRGLVHEVVKRFEQRGFKLVAMKVMLASEELLGNHYVEHKEKGFFHDLVSYMMSGPVVAMIWEGKGVVTTGRAMLGKTNPLESAPGTIRGDFCIEKGRNIVHGSDSVESAKREIALWFDKNDIVDWSQANEEWLYDMDDN